MKGNSMMYLGKATLGDRKERVRQRKRWNQCDAELAALMKALSHPVRVEVPRVLPQKRTCPYRDIASAIALAQSTVSQHLVILRKSGLIRRRVFGVQTSYRIKPARLKRLKASLSAVGQQDTHAGLGMGKTTLRGYQRCADRSLTVTTYPV